MQLLLSGLWCRRPADEHPTPHIRRDALLDGTRGHPTSRVRLQSGYVVPWNHCHRDGARRAAVSGVPPHARALPDPEGKTSGVGRAVLRGIQRVRRSVPYEGPQIGSLRLFPRHESSSG